MKTNKKTLLLQFRTDKSLKHEREQIIKNGEYKKSELEIVNVLDPKSKLPAVKDLDKYKAVITGASGQFNVTDWDEKIGKRIKKLYPFFTALVEKNIPTLAICFGHQLVAILFGGEVKRDKKQAEGGTVKVSLTSKGKKSKLFKDIPENFWVVSGHKDSVTKLPKKAEVLAYNENCKYHSYQLGDNFFAVQFHPELDREGLVWRLCMYPEYTQGKTVEQIADEFHKIPHAKKIISNFRQIVEN